MSDAQFLRIALDWVPFLIFIALLFYFVRQVRGPKGQIPYQEAQRNYIRDHLAETRRMNDNLERIAKALEQRQS